MAGFLGPGNFLNNKQLEVIRLIGSGGFGSVYLVKNQRNQYLVLNLILTINYFQKFFIKSKFRELACKFLNGLHFDDEPINEIEILKQSKHENIIEYVDFFNENMRICILTRFYKVKRCYIKSTLK